MDPVVLLVGHGSRVREANAALERLVAEVRRRAGGAGVLGAYLEAAEPDLDAGIDEAARAAGRGGVVAVVPLILARAAHVKVDLEAAVARGRARHPAVALRCAAHLGAHPAVAAVLAARAAAALDGAPAAGATLLFVARGSSDPEAAAGYAELAARVAGQVGFGRHALAFMGVARPDVPSALAACSAQGRGTVVVLPHLLADGVLGATLRARWLPDARRAHPDVDFRLAAVLGPDPALAEAALALARAASGG